MGINARIDVYAPNEDSAMTACRAAFSRVAELDSIMSDYRIDSELNRLCANAGGPPVKVSADLFKVLSRAQEVSQRSGGAFDITVRPIVQLWRNARKSGVLPAPADIEAARKLVGWQNLKLNARDRTAQLLVPGMMLDLGGIAKGFAGDEAQRTLKKNGINCALVEMGGDIVVSNPPPKTKGWMIRVPNAGEDHGPIDLQFKNCAISTSGDTEQFVVIGGVQYSHVVDPRTGQALTNRVQSTIVAKDGLTSDPLSTAMTIVPVGDRSKLLKAYRGTTLYIRELRSP